MPPSVMLLLCLFQENKQGLRKLIRWPKQEFRHQKDFDPIRHVLEHIPSEDDDLTYFEKKEILQILRRRRCLRWESG
ncbi:hypothetical protein AAC387_Pa01g4426 [Persea americana]